MKLKYILAHIGKVKGAKIKVLEVKDEDDNLTIKLEFILNPDVHFPDEVLERFP